MTRFFLALIRITALALSFLLSTFAASLFITFVLFLGSDAGWLQEDPFVVMGAIGFATGAWITIAQLAFVPFIAITSIAEFARLASLLVNLLTGGFCALAILVLSPSITNGESLPYESPEIWLTSLAAGFVGGLSHWILAGHRAGRWLGSQQKA